MAEINLNDKFPELQPVDKPPSLWTVNGVGLSILGARDKDAETQTYIKTHAFTFLFVPIFALGAYRVAKAGGNGWYFIGREPLSALAKAWNVAIVFALVGGVSYGVWSAKYNSPDAIAARKITHAETLVADGRLVDAAQTYQSVANGTSGQAGAARQSLVKMHELPQLKSTPLSQIAKLMQLELASRRDSTGDPVGQSVFHAAMNVVESRGDEDLIAANELCRVVRRVLSKSEEVSIKRFSTLRQSVLEKLVASNPGKMQYASDLAETLETSGDLKRCEELLTPHVDNLAATEGARILGQIWASQGKAEKAFGVLDPYCEVRLAQLTNAESAFESTYEQEQRLVLSRLNRGDGPEIFYRQYDKANETQQQVMIQEYLEKQLKSNPAIGRARKAYVSQTDVVPVALDLGMVRLRRGQAMENLDDRRQELEAAEKTFKSIRSVAGDSDEYRLYMGQVNYWLGKYDEGRQLFENLLDSNEREHSILLAVAGMVREVGRFAEATKLAEEAYEKAVEPQQRYEAAMRRAAMMTDNDDQLKWLERSDLTQPTVNASYQSARATAAYLEGDFDTAKASYRDAISAYDKTPETVATLNNSGLTCFSLYRVTGEQADFDDGLQRVEKAMSLQPADSILRINASHILLSAAYADLAGDQVDLAILKADASRELPGNLYNNANEKQTVIRQFRQHKGAKRAIELLNNVLLLAPKDSGAYQTLASIAQFQRDLPELMKLHDRIVSARPEIDTQETLDFFAGKEDEKTLKASQAAIDRAENGLKQAEAGSLTHAVLVSNLVDYYLQRSSLVPVEDIDRLVTLAKDAYQSSPSSSSRWAVIHAFAARAHDRLIKADDTYRLLAESTRRMLHCSTVLALAAMRDDSLGKQIHEDHDVIELMKLVRVSNEAFPETPGPWEWAMLRHSDPSAAATVAKKMKANEQADVVRKINAILAPASLETAVQSAWVDLALGNPEAADNVLQRVKDLGVAIPFELAK